MPTDDAQLRELLQRSRTVAVVGLSDKPDRDSNQVARYLQSNGYRVIPVNPMAPEILGEKSYPSVTAIPDEIRVDLVDIFRRSDQVEPVVAEALDRPEVLGIWMQLGVAHPAAAARARAAGRVVVEDRCVMQEHRRLFGTPAGGRP
ncbi:MAG: CoA-binding protein [Thermoplasmata archaeon]|jgi:predicted CoA-binding protein